MSEPAPAKPVSLFALVGDSISFGVVDISNKAIGFLLLPITTALLGRADFGLGSLFSTTTQMLLLLSAMGIPISFFRSYSERTGEQDRRAVAATSFWLLTCCTVFCLTPILVASPWVSAAIFEQSGIAFPVALVLMTTLSSWNTLANCRLQADGRRRTFVLINVTSTVVSRSTMVFLLFQGWGVWGWILGDMLGEGVTALLMSRFASAGLAQRWSLPLAREILVYGAALVPVGLSHWVMSGCDKYMIRALLPHGLAEVGLYSFGERIASILQLVNVAFLFGWRRFVFSNMHRPDGPRLLSRGVTVYFVLAAYCLLGILLLADDLVYWFFAPEFQIGTAVVGPLTVALLGWGMGEALSVGMHKTRRTGVLALLHMVAAGANVGLNFYLIPRFGIMGAAVATAFCQVAKGFGIARVSQRLYPIPIEYARLLGAGLLFATIYLLGMGANQLERVASGGVQLVLVALTPFLLMAGGFLHGTERERLRSLWGRLRG